MNVYSLVPLIGGISALFLGITALAKNVGSRLNQIFSLFIFSVVIWLLATFLMFSSTTEASAVFWDRIVYIAIVFTPILLHHFISLFTENVKKQKPLIYLGYFISFIFLILSTTDYFITGLYRYNWGVHAQAKPLHTLFFAFFAFYIILTFLNIYSFQKKATGIQKNQANYMLLAFFVIAITSFAFLPAYGIDIIFPFPYFTAFLCVLIFFLAIVRYHLFGIRVIATELLTFSIWVTLAVKVFFSNSSQDLLINIIIFLLVVIFGILLIRSAINEVKQREKMEKMAKEVERAYVVEKKANEELKNLDKFKNQFLVQTQHDLRTPLTTIKGYCELLLDGTFGKQPKKTIDVIERIQTTTENKIKDVNNFLDITQFQLGKKVVALKPGVELNSILSEIVLDLSANARAKGISLELKKSAEKFVVEADREKLKSAIYNIVDNSIKYTAKGGVSVAVQHPAPSTQHLIITVKDTGIGMSQERIQKLFDTTFERGEEAKKAFATGRGVGLYLSGQIIKAHNGKVWAESEGEGKGSTFYVELPIKIDGKTATQEPESGEKI